MVTKLVKEVGIFEKAAGIGQGHAVPLGARKSRIRGRESEDVHVVEKRGRLSLAKVIIAPSHHY
jgi:hypothetical protein